MTGYDHGCSYSLVGSVLDIVPGIPGVIPSSGKNFVFHNILDGFKSRHPIKLRSLSGMRVQAASLLMTCGNAGQILQTSDTGQNTKGEPVNLI